jgi:N,N'-diacetylchitobiose phosphorylase
MRYGYFDDSRRAYVIERPDTPMSWVNYLGTDEYCAIVSNNAAGYAFHQSPKSGRMLRFRFNSVPQDRPGRYFYLRDADDGDVWSVTWQPVAKPFRTADGEVVRMEGSDPKAEAATYRAEHQPGVSTFSCEYRDIVAKAQAFVPIGENAEVWSVTLENRGSRRRTLDLFGYVEWCFWHISQDLLNFQYILYVCRMGTHDGIIDYSLRLWPFEEPKGYFASTHKVDSFDTDREAFLGPYRHEGEPRGVRTGKLSGSLAVGGTPVGALHHHLTLEPGQTVQITFIAGVGEAQTKGVELRTRFQKAGAVDEAIAAIERGWSKRLGCFQLKTPDPAVNSMGNVWNQVQCQTTFNWSRSASFNEAGGRDGLGYRDTCQDILGVLHSLGEQVKPKLLDLLRAQHSFGAAMHHVQPLTWKQGAHNVTPPHFSDDHLWLLLTVPAYVRETGDAAILDEIVPFADQGEASIYEHLKKALDFSWESCGPHGLCLGLAADWNDCLNLRGKGESTFSTFLFIHALKQFGLLLPRTLASHPERAADAEHYASLHQAMLARVDACAWDGDWFVRGFVDSGKPIGSKTSHGSTIFLNAQSWAVFAEVGSEAQRVRAMDSVHERLATEHGAVLNAPCYVDHDAEVGAITTFPPGLKENGGIFCHANTWPIVAEALLGRGDEAFRLYKAFLPAAKNDTADKYSMEPYAYAQFITGKEHPYHFGRARNSWLTGTASWAYVALTQYILGVRADYDALIVDPVLPSEWHDVEVTRVFRGATYHIVMRGSGKPEACKVNGAPLALGGGRGARIPVAPRGSHVEVELTLG